MSGAGSFGGRGTPVHRGTPFPAWPNCLLRTVSPQSGRVASIWVRAPTPAGGVPGVIVGSLGSLERAQTYNHDRRDLATRVPAGRPPRCACTCGSGGMNYG